MLRILELGLLVHEPTHMKLASPSLGEKLKFSLEHEMQEPSSSGQNLKTNVTH